MSIALKIKSKSLAEEAIIIRREERKLLSQAKHKRERQENTSDITKEYRSLHLHRKVDVRNESRATYLARAFIAGTPYSKIESSRKPTNEYTFQTFIIPRIVTMANKYGRKWNSETRKWTEPYTKEDILNWINF